MTIQPIRPHCRMYVFPNGVRRYGSRMGKRKRSRPFWLKAIRRIRTAGGGEKKKTAIGGKKKTVGGGEKKMTIGGGEKKKTAGGEEEKKTAGAEEKEKQAADI